VINGGHSSLNPNQIPTYDDTLRYNLFSKLRTLHSAGFLHGDVQPRNTIIADDGIVRLIDLSEASANHRCPDSRKLFPDNIVSIIFCMKAPRCSCLEFRGISDLQLRLSSAPNYNIYTPL
jgi:serine/threonine protein kinase